MAYAYGMRFDDDSNAITVIDEDNQTAVTTGYINGDYVEFGGGNPNHVQKITGTVATPVGEEGSPGLFASISEAIFNDNATAIMFITVGQQTGWAYLWGSNNGAQLQGYASIFSTDGFLTMRVVWDLLGGNIVLGDFESIQGANGSYQVTDLKSMASGCPTDLTIVWHPLPEE